MPKVMIEDTDPFEAPENCVVFACVIAPMAAILSWHAVPVCYDLIVSQTATLTEKIIGLGALLLGVFLAISAATGFFMGLAAAIHLTHKAVKKAKSPKK